MKNLILVVVLLLIISSLTFGQSAQATVTAKVRLALSVQKTQDLDLGFVIKGTTKTVLSSDAAAAAFTVTGDVSAPVTVTVGFPVNLISGSNNLTFTGQIPMYSTSNLQSGASSTGFTLTGGTATTDGTSGNLYLWMGGGVSPLANQATGDYTGTINVSVIY